MEYNLKTIDELILKVKRDVDDRRSELLDEMPFYCTKKKCNNQLTGFVIYSKETQHAYCNASSSCASEAAFELYQCRKHKVGIADDPATLYRIPVERLKELWEEGKLKQTSVQFKKADKYFRKAYSDLKEFENKAISLCTTIRKIQYKQMEDKKLKTSKGITFYLSNESLNLKFRHGLLIPMSINSSDIEATSTLTDFHAIVIKDRNELSNVYAQIN